MNQLSVIAVLFTAQAVAAQEVIPFELREDNRIYLDASVNDSKPLSFLFDLGANVTVVNKTRLEENEIAIEFDGVVSNGGTNGQSNESISRGNSVGLGTRVYLDMEVLGIAYPKDAMLDGILGWNTFKDKVIRINYERGQLTVFEALPALSDHYRSSDLKLINNLPYLHVEIHGGQVDTHGGQVENEGGTEPVQLWAMLDTGYNAELLVYYEEVLKHDLIGQFQVIGQGWSHGTDGLVLESDQVLLPRFRINGFEIYNMPANLTKTESKSTKPALLGGNLLKRFHTVIDFKNGKIYLKPNGLINSSF